MYKKQHWLIRILWELYELVYYSILFVIAVFFVWVLFTMTKSAIESRMNEPTKKVLLVCSSKKHCKNK
jgi:hypothetical protein